MARLRKKPPPQYQTTQAAHTSDTKARVMSGTQGLRVGGAGSWSVRTQWIFFAVASGACAAFNGVFAKLTTTSLTTSLSNSIANALGLSDWETVMEYIMWSLFTTALAKGTSTTQVSIMNTSANFMLTAFMGAIIFSEQLPLMWWAGAAFLVIGNVIIGRKDESKEGAGEDDAGYAAAAQSEDVEPRGLSREEERETRDEDVIDLGDLHDETR
ncbi:Transmembrane protein-like protein [Emericellopsis cladophorae]|uniref:Transmembrane protein-like protein n=1 Tax=Emericellopsis cladophorae TaxID=2686198 RepID=A0A9Q0BEM8_9HYPO|nr:Transmembrane protein-like protein [Emericellopsis cladophorae]KAI6781399.1 Transmembrane protein-like protein [Emericellopsis cladophorae]